MLIPFAEWRRGIRRCKLCPSIISEQTRPPRLLGSLLIVIGLVWFR
jgi:hypothetical protein